MPPFAQVVVSVTTQQQGSVQQIAVSVVFTPSSSDLQTPQQTANNFLAAVLSSPDSVLPGFNPSYGQVSVVSVSMQVTACTGTALLDVLHVSGAAHRRIVV